MSATTERHICSYPAQPFADDGTRNDRGKCMVPGCTVPRGRTVPVDEAFLRTALRDALAFAQYHATAGDPDSPAYIREYEVALLQLADAPEVTPADEVAMLRCGAETLGKVVVHQARSMEAARIEYLQNGAVQAMQWILASIPDVDDNEPEDQWDGKESAREWLDRTDERKAVAS